MILSILKMHKAAIFYPIEFRLQCCIGRHYNGRSILKSAPTQECETVSGLQFFPLKVFDMASLCIALNNYRKQQKVSTCITRETIVTYYCGILYQTYL